MNEDDETDRPCLYEKCVSVMIAYVQITAYISVISFKGIIFQLNLSRFDPFGDWHFEAGTIYATAHSGWS